VVLHITVGVAIAAAYRSTRPLLPARWTLQGVTRWWHHQLLAILGVRLRVLGQVAQAPVLMLANHVSWLDTPLLGSIVPVRFLSKAEVSGWPVIGLLATAAGTLYIRRGARGSAERATGRVTDALHRGARVLVFPEGTTSDGREVLHFHPRLLEAAIRAERPVQPVAIRYPHPLGVHPRVPFVGDDARLPHLLALLGEPRVEAHVHLLPPLPAGLDRRALAARAEQAVRAVVTDREVSP
jgi:1-acyl-sn-glycerol-3-phosphate acyltransferase